MLTTKRIAYQELKNQLDLVIQPSLLFSIDEQQGAFVKYIDDENIDAQGVKVRCQFTDTIAEVKDKIKAKMQIEGNFQMIEVQRL